MKRAAVAGLIAACACPLSVAAGFVDGIADLKGRTIVYAGEIDHVSCPIAGKYDCMQWPRGFYKTSDGDCFVTDETSCGFSCKALIAADRNRQLSVFVVQPMGSDFNKSSFQSYKCASLY